MYLVIDRESFTKSDFRFFQTALLELRLSLKELAGKLPGGELRKSPTPAFRHADADVVIVEFEVVSEATATHA